MDEEWADLSLQDISPPAPEIKNILTFFKNWKFKNLKSSLLTLAGVPHYDLPVQYFQN